MISLSNNEMEIQTVESSESKVYLPQIGGSIENVLNVFEVEIILYFKHIKK